mmetsp:Transcript_9038/g.18091  ORF Transcript_9038/g.18091 Transcript_9038/m.18091 type:complete len:96 (-) Transcript_9038:26-313(-)|eukprot:CAMPEP_0182462762 /NCGR_PEP_ID=MMETSP1319-20130603/6915_1 /TAXON_ID=172717 /ORGANISM="Bolidomonas pacifica, Strain RCC208" /LENGTH=95 /DNA_ID=CAMNT_0024662219 /DNA_START=345 /DNA_END=632 /DNA_ORIENTATION=+
MASNKGPDLRRYMDKVLCLKLNGSRSVTGVLRGYDQFLNVVLSDAKEDLKGGGENAIGQVVVRGNSIVQFECLGLVDRQKPKAETGAVGKAQEAS